MEEYEDNVPDENIQIESPKKCNFILKEKNMFINSERINKYNKEDENKPKSDYSEKLQTKIKEPILFSNSINLDLKVLKEPNESNLYQSNKIQDRKITEEPKFPEPKIVNINLNNLYKENTKLYKKTKNKNITKNNKNKNIIHRNNYIKKVNYEQNNLTQRPKAHNISKLLKENKSNSLNKDFLAPHFNIKNLKVESSKNPKQIMLEKKAITKLFTVTKKTASKTNNLSRKEIPKEINEIKIPKKIKVINYKNNNSNKNFLKDCSGYKNDSKGSATKLKKGLNLKLENNKKFLFKKNKNHNLPNNSTSILINYKNLSKIHNPNKSKIYHTNHSHNKNKKSTPFILGFKAIIKIFRKKLKYFFEKLRRFNHKRIISISKEYRIDSPIKNIFKKNIYIYGTNRKSHKYKDKNNFIHHSAKRGKTIKNIKEEIKKTNFSSYKKNNGNNLFLLYPYSNIKNFNINTIQINLFSDDLLYRISKNVNNKRLASEK